MSSIKYVALKYISRIRDENQFEFHNWINLLIKSPFIFHTYTPNSKTVALGIGNLAWGSYCLAVTQAKHCIVFI